MSDTIEKRSMDDIATVQSPVAKDPEAAIVKNVLPGPPPFRWSSLWQPAQINPLNGKSYTLPMFRLTDQYAINFHSKSRELPFSFEFSF